MTLRSLLRRKAALKPQTSMQGGIEGVCCGVVWGVGISRAHADAPARVEFMLDGRSIGSAQTTVMRSEYVAATAAGVPCGFAFDLRPHLHGVKRGTLAVRDATTGLAFGEEVALDLAGASGRLDMGDGIDVLGWATPHAPGQRDIEIEIRIDGVAAGTVRTDRPRPDLRWAGAPLSRAGFRFAVPVRYHDGQPHKVMAHVAATGAALHDEPVTFCAQTRAYIDAVDEHHISGWIANLKAPSGAVRFDLWINGELVERDVTPKLRREDVEYALFGGPQPACPIGFDLRWRDALAWLPSGNTIELRFPEGSEVLHGPVHVLETVKVLGCLEALAGAMLTGAPPAHDLEPALLTAAREQLAQAVNGLRMRGRAPLLVVDPPAPPAAAPVDIIVPVYKGREETLACLASVLAALPDGPAAELVVIFDAGPDLALKAELRALAAAEGFTLIENTANLGFVATANKGMRLHPERDVVLLNADTVVPRNWLQRLRAAALSAPEVATATPLSNRATIFSLPRTCVDNDMPLGLDVAALDALCAERNAQVRAEVPTAMGFCMYIRRAALVDVGLFDETRWAMGYGEENDFSLRALARGWRHLAACDVFVEHHGAVSFGADKPRRVQENLARLNAIYPDYPQRIERFIEDDPIALARGRVNMALLKQIAPSWVLFVSHGLGGGTDTAIADLCKLHEAEGRRVLLLRSTVAGRMELIPLVKPHDQRIVAEYPRDTPLPALAQQLAELAITQVHIHHSLGFAADIWQLPALLGVPFEATLHDYFTICPRITMIDASGQFCGEPDVAVCERCVKTPRLERAVQRQFELAGASVADWRAFHAARLREASRVSAPSEDAARRLARHLPELQVQALPHVEPVPATPAKGAAHPALLQNVAVIGAIGPHKGVDLLLECAKLAQRMDLPLRFVIVGYTNRDEDFAALDNVEIMGRYRQDDLPRLLAGSQCGAALFLSVWPETYSYTLSEAWRAGLLPVALDIGAQAERIREQGHGVLIPFPATAREVVEALMAAAHESPCGDACHLN
ncbi:MAG: glycosyltransferase [Ideonella sp.]|nr:glycosyltransferase [Ideonella sp.]